MPARTGSADFSVEPDPARWWAPYGGVDPAGSSREARCPRICPITAGSLDTRDDPNLAPAHLAGLDLNAEHPLEALCPGHRPVPLGGSSCRERFR